MIWTLIFVAIFIVALVLFLICCSDYKLLYETPWLLSLTVTIIAGIVLVFMCVAIISGNSMRDEHIAELNAERESIAYQVDNGLYFGDSLGKFNVKIITGRKLHDNPWTSWFYGDYYYEVEPIDISQK